MQLQDKKETYFVTNSKVNNEHDKIFRKILDNKHEATNFINKTLNLKIKEERLEKYNSSFITNNLENQESDIIYKLKDKNIFFLIEHQTKIDYSMPYRILEYENEIMKSAIDYKKINQKRYKLPLVIAIVLYTGNKKWDAKQYIKEVQENLEGYKELQFARYNIVDVNEIDNDELLKDKSFLTKAMLLEKAKNNEELAKYLDEIIKEMNNGKIVYNNEIKEIFRIITEKILRRKIGNEKADELIKILKGGNKSMLAVLEMIEKDNQRIFTRGRREGVKQGILEVAKKMIIKKVPISEISDITGLSEKEIREIKVD